MCTHNELRIILNQMLKAYLSVYGTKLVKVMLYGSYARGDNRVYSDIDIVAIIYGERRQLQEGLKIIWDKSSDLELDTIGKITSLSEPWAFLLNLPTKTTAGIHLL